MSQPSRPRPTETDRDAPEGGAPAPTVAVLGTGIMGAAMARNMLRAGLPVRVWNRTRARAEPLAGDGAHVAEHPAEAVTGADVVVTMLTDGPTVLETMRAAEPALAQGVVWAQSATVGDAATTELAAFAEERGLVFVDAPVSGTRAPAENGRLVVLAAGPERARPVLAPVFDAIGSRTQWVAADGGSAAASKLKLVANSWVAALTHATAEALGLARGLDVDPQAFLDLVAGGPLDNGYLRAKSAAMLADDYTPSFSVANAEKDGRLIVDAARRAGVHADLAEAGVARFARARERGHGDDDMAASYLAGFDS